MSDAIRGRTAEKRRHKPFNIGWKGLVGRGKAYFEGERARRASERPETKAARWTAIATAVIAAFTIALAFVGWLQYREVVNSSESLDRMNRIYRGQAAQLNRQAIETKGLSEQTAILASRMKDQADISENTLKIGQAAYVTIGKPDGTVADIIWPKTNDGKAGLVVYFQNNGRLPAKFNWGADGPIIALLPSDPTIFNSEKWNDGKAIRLATDHYFQPMFRAKNPKEKSFQWSGTIDIGGGSSYQGVLWELPKERMTQLINYEKGVIPIGGRFEYCDGFGNRICKNFQIRYTQDRFVLASEDQCMTIEMQVIHPKPDLEYLPVCALSEKPEFLTPSLPSSPKPK